LFTAPFLPERYPRIRDGPAATGPRLRSHWPVAGTGVRHTRYAWACGVPARTITWWWTVQLLLPPFELPGDLAVCRVDSPGAACRYPVAMGWGDIWNEQRTQPDCWAGANDSGTDSDDLMYCFMQYAATTASYRY